MANNIHASPRDFQSPLHHQDSPQHGGLKRKASDDDNPGGISTGGGAGSGSQTQQQRAKRNRYISIACNECKRRKIKCNGQTPCQRCGNLNLECVYAPNCCNGFKDSAEYKEMTAQMAALQDHVAALYNDFAAMRAHLGAPSSSAAAAAIGQQQQLRQTPIDPSLQGASFGSGAHSASASGTPHPGVLPSPGGGAPMAPMSPSAPRPKSHHTGPTQPTFRGPTSNDFNFGVAKSSLKTMGITAGGTHDGNGADGLSGGAGSGTREPSPAANSPASVGQMVQAFHRDKDPIWSVPQEEALRLCDVYEDEMGLMYPVLDIENIKAYAKRLYGFMEAAQRTGLMQQSLPGSDGFDDEDTSILKLVLATGMVTEDGGRNEVGKRMFERVQPSLDNLLLEKGTVKGIRMLAMAAMYEFHRDRESTSWRLIGLAARVCIELGLHRRETYDAMQDQSERHQTILLFWSIYVLDRRWAFGTGMPFALQDADIDPMCPKPEGRSPYLSAMIEFSTIGAKVWQSVVSSSASGSAPINTSEMEYLDYQIVQWQSHVPQHLQFNPSEIGRDKTALDRHATRAGRRLPLLLYLRRNQMRMSIYRPVLHTATSIMQYRSQAHKVVEIAKDTIRLLTHIKSTSDLYDTQQMLFNAFLTAALAVLFLAVAHTPALFAENVREEYYMGIDLVRNFSRDSYIGKRLWRTVRVLLDVAPKLGLTAKDREAESRRASAAQHIKGELDPSRSAAVAMAGLAGHNVDELALYQSGGWSGTETRSSTSPEALANNLSNLFEAAGGYQPIGNGSVGGAHGTDGGLFNPGDDAGDGVDYNQEELSEILKGLF